VSCTLYFDIYLSQLCYFKTFRCAYPSVILKLVTVGDDQRSCSVSSLVGSVMGDCSRVQIAFMPSQPPSLTQPGHPSGIGKISTSKNQPSHSPASMVLQCKMASRLSTAVLNPRSSRKEFTFFVPIS